MAIHERSASTLSLCAVRMEGSAMTGFDPEESAPGKLAKNRRCKSPTGKV